MGLITLAKNNTKTETREMQKQIIIRLVMFFLSYGI